MWRPTGQCIVGLSSLSGAVVCFADVFVIWLIIRAGCIDLLCSPLV